MKAFVLLAVTAACLLAGCAAPRPPAALPPEPAAQWQAPLPHGGSAAALRDWWQRLGDPLLTELIEAAQAASPTLSAAQARIEQARAARVAAGAALLPALDASAAASRGNNQPPAPLASTVQAGVQTAWEIDLFGANRDAERAAQARLEGAQAGWHEARVAVAAETANGYLALRSCERQHGVAERDAQSRRETARLAELSARAGFTAPGDAALARASAADAGRRLTQQRAQCELEVKGLVALTGLAEPGLRQRLAGGWREPPPQALPAVPALPAQLLAQRPDVYRAEREVAAASAEVGSAQAQRYPRLTLSGSIAAGRVRAGGVSADLQTWSIGPLALTLPLFDGGRRAANAEAAQARYADAANQYRARVRQAVREVEEALLQLESARARGEDARVAAEGYAASLAAVQARYGSGLASLLELEESRRTALAAETTLVTLQQERLAAWIALYRAAGGGWTAPAPALTAKGS
ncbi:efflux transporter outer membrane subunit [Ramlibacter sp.]|uniref:efflux transporter outer membrane subunit n=1 Tax=Ramlibacter sp. TaxID=1917967 RepID=UPI002C84AD0E|nr:efflux transporter outer membrane subunit [Ramlibacter sp.]HWI84020.1 efflux transporter outer membrane subunit [Ramlibacter sp.]